ncbi:hypothetical protein BDF19DRAFT_442252 [Syncephalis fuscata]|nr:hypothetical protein BDF19DRAFT_442252 [Syncephalis fuscata]
MSLFESAAAALLARAHRDSDALLSLSCASTRQRIVLLRDSLPPEELWQWQQEDSATANCDDTQALIEHLFTQSSVNVSKVLSPATFRIIDGATRRARLRFAVKKVGQINSSLAGLSYEYYIIMEREPDGIWRYFNTIIEKHSTTINGNDGSATKSIKSDLWFDSIGMAEDAARHGGKPVGTDALTTEIAFDKQNNYVAYGQPSMYENNENDDEDDDDNYWAMYDSSTPAKASLPSRANVATEDDYWSRYDAIDSQTPPPRKDGAKAAQSNAAKHVVPDNSSRQLSSIGDPRDVLLQNLRVLRHMAERMGINKNEFIEMARQA